MLSSCWAPHAPLALVWRKQIICFLRCWAPPASPPGGRSLPLFPSANGLPGSMALARSQLKREKCEKRKIDFIIQYTISNMPMVTLGQWHLQGQLLS